MPRVLSLAPSITEIIFALGEGHQLVGVTNVCDYPQAACALPKVSGWTTKHDIASLARYRPDLIFTDMYLPPGLSDWCQEHGVQHIHVHPHTLIEVMASITTVGAALDRTAAADQLNRRLHEQCAALRKTQPLRPRLRIYSEEWHTPPMIGGNWVPELITLAGGIPLAPPGKMSAAITTETVQHFDPDIIIAHWCGFGERSRLRTIAARPGWNQLRAVYTNQIFTVHDSLLNRPGPRLIEGARALKRILNIKHPYEGRSE